VSFEFVNAGEGHYDVACGQSSGLNFGIIVMGLTNN